MITNCTCLEGKDRRIKSIILQTVSQGLSSIIGADVKDFISTDIQGNTNETRHPGNASSHVCVDLTGVMNSLLTNFSSALGGDPSRCFTRQSSTPHPRAGEFLT